MNKNMKRVSSALWSDKVLLYLEHQSVSNGSSPPLPPPIIFLGKVYVSHIVDYLRHTTSRSSEDSGLEELCNMLDPEHKDVSIDLDTYHAVMREWIDDCRNNGY